MVGAIYAAVRLRPAWFSALTCYDLALLSVWLFVVAANGNRLRRAKREAAQETAGLAATRLYRLPRSGFTAADSA